MRIAILGTRGIPARYGGFETFAEELATRLVSRGHAVTVYCRQPHETESYRGVRLVYLPPIRHKYLETVIHTLVSTFHLLAHRVDVALYCNAANALFTWMPRLARIPVALNVDGLERKRKKWNRVGQAWYEMSERIATWFPNVTISDAERIAEYYRTRYGKETKFIPYGASIGALETSTVLDQLGLRPREYFLYVSRMEPENNALLVREAFEQVPTDKKLALIGDAPYAEEYIARVRATRDPRVLIPGAIYGAGYHELQSHSFAYIHATEVGGTHPALIEAMGRGALTLYLDTAENAEVAGGAGVAFTEKTLVDRLRDVVAMPEQQQQALRRAAQQRVQSRYSWDAVTDQYEKLFEDMLARH